MAWFKGTRYGDDIDGTNYDDIIEGFGGNDELWGLGGNDELYGGSGDDILVGGSGHDDLYGGTGWDFLEGGTGDDNYYVDSYNDDVVEYAGEGIDAVYTALSAYTLPAHVEDLVYEGYADFEGIGNGRANYIYGGDYDDTLQGLDGADRLWGYDGEDTLVGGAGRDRISAGAGDDWLFGGSGNDVLTGGTGFDDFHFDTALNRSTNVDHITDFDPGIDAIFLDRAIFKALSGNGPLNPSAYVEGTRALDSSDRIVFDQAAGKIFYDPDGAGGAAQILFATVTPGTDLAAADFFTYG